MTELNKAKTVIITVVSIVFVLGMDLIDNIENQYGFALMTIVWLGSCIALTIGGWYLAKVINEQED